MTFNDYNSLAYNSIILTQKGGEQMFNGTIYRITNKVNNKIYIGQTIKTAEQRFERHKKDAKHNSEMAIHRAIRKYGQSNFKTETLERNIGTQNELDILEVQHIKNSKSYKKEIGYNISLGGYSGKFNRKLSPEEVEKIIEMIEKTEMTFTEIGKKFDVAISTISDINKGKTWFNDTINYPIRVFNTVVYLTVDKVTKIKEMLREDTHRLMEIAELENVTLSAVANINNGVTHIDIRAKYPIIKTSSINGAASNTDKIKEIIRDLILGYEYIELSTKYNLNKTTISDLDKGRTWESVYPGQYPISKYGYMCKELFGIERDKIVDLDEL